MCLYADMMADDARTFFHVSSKNACKATNSERFMGEIKKALTDIKALFPPLEEKKKEVKA